jgi:hypothetical protein
MTDQDDIRADPDFLAEMDALAAEYVKMRAESRATKPAPPPPKPGCVCAKRGCNFNSIVYSQPLDCPGGDLCFTKVRELKGRALTKATLALMRLGVCVCSGWVPGPRYWRKSRRERITIQCGCGAWFSNAVVRANGWWSKNEWRKKGYKVKPGQEPVGKVWRCWFWKGGHTGRMVLAKLYDRSQVEPVGPALGLEEAKEIINNMIM